MTAKRGERQRESCIDDDMLDEFPSELTAEQLAALLCARLCHDLVSPVSALGAALSVLDDQDSADMHEDAMGLVRESARQAQAKLEFSRLAFGAGGSAPGILDTRELRRLTENMFSAFKPSFMGDTIWARTKILDLRPKKNGAGVAVSELLGVNQRKETILRCEFSLLVRGERLRPAAADPFSTLEFPA